MHGLFITFEGIDGSGKSTQLRLCTERLTSRGITAVATREPGGTAAGAAIRQLLLQHREPRLVAEAELLLYAADRAQHVQQVIRPALDGGSIVLCDRFADATEAYQGYGRGLDLELIARLNEVATGGLVPDATLVFDLDLPEAARRLRSRGDESNRFDDEAAEFHARVREGYRRIAASNPDRVVVVDATGSVEHVAARVDEAILPKILTSRSTTV